MLLLYSLNLKSKWTKTCFLQNTSLKHHIPETALFNISSLTKMLNKYEMVYVKPDGGSGGKGVVRVEQIFPSLFELREGVKTSVFDSISDLHATIKYFIGDQKYLIQQGIDMISHQGKKFDIRVLVQKNLKNKWEVTAILSRKMAPNKIITNLCNKGVALSLSAVMQSHMDTDSIKKLRHKLEQICLSIGREFSKKYRNAKELGIDVALDEDMHPWILEVNTKPHLHPHSQVTPTDYYYRILPYAKAYGRNINKVEEKRKNYQAQQAM